jgi:hypothetical protein
MSKSILLLLLVLNTFILRFWHLNIIPPLLNSSLANERIYYALIGVFNILLIYKFSRIIFPRNNTPFISMWVYSILPWAIEQGRIISQPDIALFIFLIYLNLSVFLKSKFQKIILFIIFVFSLKFFYPQIWINRSFVYKTGYFFDSIKNIFSTFSFDYLFFNNNYFYLGGVRNFGILYKAFLPFIIFGMISLINRKKNEILFGIVILGIFASFSPLYPETREFYLSLPFLIITISTGIKTLYSARIKTMKILGIILILLLVYEYAQYLHYYFVHYSIDLKIVIPQIKDKF